MFDGLQRRVVSIWFPRLASDRVLRLRPIAGPFVLTLREANAERLHCLNQAAERQGLHRGMSFADARAFCPDLQSRPADLQAEARFLHVLRRWATRYCPWVGLEGDDGLVLDITGSAHLFGGESQMLADMRQSLGRAGVAAHGGRPGRWPVMAKAAPRPARPKRRSLICRWRRCGSIPIW